MNLLRRIDLLKQALPVCLLFAAAAAVAPVPKADACGGFFCQSVPINQAAEQIIFRKDGDMVTAVVLIQYMGEAEDFSWVVPVPGIPELSTGSDLVFPALDFATRPQFNLITNGEACQQPNFSLGNNSPEASDGAAGGDDSDVEVLARDVVGPFDVVVVTSEDPDAMAQWLTDNDYDLADRGEELIAPYVAEGMNFVGLRLQQDKGVGDLQPLIMRYESENIMIPIRLTAVAAEDDMGVLTWILGESRAVPINYLHVTPNYTLLNWYAGTTNAYGSYQNLITAAMDEAGGQGFATDYAGRDLDYMSALPAVETYEEELAFLDSQADDATYVAFALRGVLPSDQTLEIIRRELPLTDASLEYIYYDQSLLAEAFTAEELAAAKDAIATETRSSVIEPLEETLAVLDGDLYMTRVYTTLSPEEMTLDPCFSFNPDLEDQGVEREATMDVACTLNGTTWSLTLGKGTGRDGERVIEGRGLPPGFTAPTIDQDSLFRSEMVAEAGAPVIVDEKQFTTAQVVGEQDEGPTLCGALGGFGCGAGGVSVLLFTMLGLQLMRRRNA